jgi:hypothetical protein
MLSGSLNGWPSQNKNERLLKGELKKLLAKINHQWGEYVPERRITPKNQCKTLKYNLLYGFESKMGKTLHLNFTRFYFYVLIPENP